MTSIREKVRHVAGAGQNRRHECHWPNCLRQVPPAMWGCREHWFKLPADLRRDIWRTYRIGQEQDGRPSLDYIQVSEEVQHWIRTGERYESASTTREMERAR